MRVAAQMRPGRNFKVGEGGRGMKSFKEMFGSERNVANRTCQLCYDKVLVPYFKELDELKENNCNNGNNPDASCRSCPQGELCA